MKPLLRRKRLTPEERRTSLESFNWSSGFRSVYDTVCGGSTFVFVAFALSVGMQKEHIGLITTVVSFACVLQILSLALTNVIRDKKGFVLTLALAEPLLLAGVVMGMPFLPAGLRVWALAVAVLAASASLHLTRPLQDSWICTMIPDGLRGRYLGRRFQAISAVTILATLAAGFVAERIDKSNTFAMACVLASGAAFGVAAVAALGRATMPAVAASARVSWQDLRGAFAVKPFRHYLIGITLINIPFMFGPAYYQVFNLQVLGLKESVIAYMLIGYYLARTLTMPFWGRRLAGMGVRRTLYMIMPLYTLFFATFLVCTPGRVWPLLAGWAVVGLADAAYAVTATAALFRAVPDTPARPAYFAIANLLGAGTLGLGALLCVPVLHALKDVSLSLGGLALGQFQLFYAACAILTIFCFVGTAFVPDKA